MFTIGIRENSDSVFYDFDFHSPLLAFFSINVPFILTIGFKSDFTGLIMGNLTAMEQKCKQRRNLSSDRRQEEIELSILHLRIGIHIVLTKL